MSYAISDVIRKKFENAGYQITEIMKEVFEFEHTLVCVDCGNNYNDSVDICPKCHSKEHIKKHDL